MLSLLSHSTICNNKIDVFAEWLALDWKYISSLRDWRLQETPASFVQDWLCKGVYLFITGLTLYQKVGSQYFFYDFVQSEEILRM